MTPSEKFPSSPKVEKAGWQIAQESIPGLSGMVGGRYPEMPADRGLNTMDARLVALRQLRYIEAAADLEQRNLVRHLRSQLATWQMIADALCMTRSGAFQKYGH